MQQPERIIAGFVDTAFCPQTEHPDKRLRNRPAFLKHIGERPKRHGLRQAVALSNRIGQRGAHIGRVAGAVHSRHIPLGPKQRQLGQRRALNLRLHLSHRAAHAVIHRNVFLRSEEILHCVVGVGVAGYKIHRHVILGRVFQELRHPGSRRRRRTTHSQPRTNAFQRARCVIVQLEIAPLSRNATPKIDIRLVPHFEVPLG